MADINNFTEITENFDTIKTLLNSIRAQGILNTSDVDKLLAGINSKLEKLNTEEDIDLIKIFLSELKQNFDERHNVLLSKFGAIESLFSNLLKNSSETLKSSEIKELFDIVATNLSVFSREVVSQKEALTDITLRIDAMRSDDSDKKEIVKNISFLKNDIERLTNGFDSIVLSLNENFKTIIKTISTIDYTESIDQFAKEITDITNSFNTILSALQMLDKKNLQIEDALRGLATQDDLNSAKQWISDLATQEQSLTQAVNGLADKYYKIDNLAEKIDASVEIIVGLKTILAENDEQRSTALIDRLNELENSVKAVATNEAFNEFKQSFEIVLNSIFEISSSVKSTIMEHSLELQKIKDIVSELDLNVSFKSIASDVKKSEQSIKDHVSVETSRILELVDANTTRALNEISTSADDFTERLTHANNIMTALCEKSFSDVVENINNLKAVVTQIDENNSSANNAIFSNITDRLAIFESGLKTSLAKQEEYVSNSSSVLIEQINNLKDLSGIFDYKLDSSVIEINNAKTEFVGLKTSVENLLSLDFVTKVKDLKVDLYAAKQDLSTALETASGDIIETLSNDLYGKYELLISKLDSVETDIQQAQTTSLNGLKLVLDNISSSIVDVLSYVSSKHELSTETLETKLDNIGRTVNDSTLNYVENVRDIVEVIRIQVENNLKSIQEDNARHFNTINSSLILSGENIRSEIKNSYSKLLEVQENFDEIKGVLSSNNLSVSNNINTVLDTANSLRNDFDVKLAELKNSILNKVSVFQKDLTCENSDNISEIKFTAESLYSKTMQNTSEMNNELKGEIAKLIGSLRLNIEEFAEQLASTSLKVEGSSNEIISYIRNDFTTKVDSSIDELLTKVSEFSTGIDLRADDVVSRVDNLEKSVEELNNKTTSALASTLSKILDNFVSLKSLLESFNERNAENVKNNIDTVLDDFETLLDKVNAVDTSIDEDFSRQLSLLESNFEMMNKNLITMLEQNDASLVNNLNLGVTNISNSVKESIQEKLEEYKEQIENLFNNISNDNRDQSILITDRIIELNKILQNSIEEQNLSLEDRLNTITKNFKEIIDNNFELTSDSYTSLKDKLGEFASDIEEFNDKLVNNLQNQFKEITNVLDSTYENQAQELNTKFNEITTNLSTVSDATLKLQDDVRVSADKISQELVDLKDDLINSGDKNYVSIINKLEIILNDITSNDDNLLSTIKVLSSTANDSILSRIGTELKSVSEELNKFVKESSEIQQNNINSHVNELSQKLENVSRESFDDLEELKLSMNSLLIANNESSEKRIAQILEEIRVLAKTAEDRASALEQVLSNNINDEVEDLLNKIRSLFEENSLTMITHLGNNHSRLIEDLNIKVNEFKECFDIINERINKDDISRMEMFRAQLKELSNTFNKLIGEAKDVTKSEVSAISETLINNSKVVMEEVEQSIEEKINSLLVTSADISAGELQTLELFVEKILDQISVNKQNTIACRDFINDFIKNEIDAISNSIEKETDIIVKDLLEQMNLMKDYQKDELSKLTIHIENYIEDSIYERINELKAYMDIKTDSSVIDNKIDNLVADFNHSIEDILSVSNKLLAADVFENSISDIKKTNEILISSVSDKLNNQLQDFIKINISKDINDSFVLFDKKFTDTVVDKYEEIKLISTNYNNSFTNIESSINALVSDFISVKEKINSDIHSGLEKIDKALDSLKLELTDLKLQVMNRISDESQLPVNNQIQEIQELIQSQFGYLEDITELCGNNLPEITEMSALVKYNVIESIREINSKLENKDASIQEELNSLKTDIITQFLNIFNQISFVAEQEEILDFIQEKHAELISILSHIVTTIDDVENIKDNLVVVDKKVDILREDIDLINEKITSIISSSGDIDYVYSLQDLESDIANLRICLNSFNENNKSEELNELIESTNNIYNLVESIKNEIPNLNTDEFKKDFDALSEDIVSISTRTNKLILASDESYKTLQENLQDFKLVINDLDERTRNFAQEVGLDRIDNKLASINSMIHSGAKTNQVFNQVFEYLAEWVDNAGAQITAISDKVETLDDIGQIKVMLEDLKAEAEDDSESVELIEALGNVFDKQAKKIASLEAKLDRVIVETTISNKNNKIDLTPMEETLNRFLVAIDDKLISQQTKINSLESKLEDVVSKISPDNTAQLTKKVGGMDRQIAKLNKSIEKIASHVIEK